MRFYGRGPGQELDELVHRFSDVDLRTVLGDDVVTLIEAITSPPQINTKLKTIATDVLRKRGNDLFARKEIQEICIDAMSTEKQAELTGRVGVTDIKAVLPFDPTKDKERWQELLGFFGIDTSGAVPFAKQPDSEVIQPTFGLFPHQRRVSDRVYDVIRGGHGRVVLHMPTGAGKTRTAMHIVSRYMTSAEPTIIVWLATSAELLDQAADAFDEAWSRLGNREISIVRFWGDYAPDLIGLSDGFIVAGLQKMHAFRSRHPIDVLRLAKSVSLVVVDEAHQAIAPTYRDTIEILSETGIRNALVGLTATPGRTWSDISADEELSDFFDGRKVMLEIEGYEDPVSFLMKQGYLAEPKFRSLEFEVSSEFASHLKENKKGDDYDPELLDLLAYQVNRNIIIVDEIRRLITNGHTRIILFGASVRHAELLAAALLAGGVDARIVTANTNLTDRTRIIRAFRTPSPNPIVLCNYGVLTTGFDAPETSAAVIARPTKSLVLYSQMVGRATRGPKAGGNKNCEISTVIDTELPGFGDVAEAFSNWEDVWREPR